MTISNPSQLVRPLLVVPHLQTKRPIDIVCCLFDTWADAAASKKVQDLHTTIPMDRTRPTKLPCDLGYCDRLDLPSCLQNILPHSGQLL
jgi:hypothetical protein